MGIYNPLALILLKSFNAIAYVLVSFLCLRRFRSQGTRWGGYAYCGVAVAFAWLYVSGLVMDWIWSTLHRPPPALFAVHDVAFILLAPLMLSVFYHNERLHLPWRRAWQLLVAAIWLAGLIGSVGRLGVQSLRELVPDKIVFPPMGIAALAGIIGIRFASRRILNPIEIRQRRWMAILFFAWGALGLLEPWLNSYWNAIALDTSTLVFVFIVTYYTERWVFFDVLLKQAVFVFSSLFLLTLYFTFVTPHIFALKMRGWIAILVWALSVWPLVLWAPWGHRKLSRWLDRLWLGRRFSPAEATRYFLDGLQGAISVDELCRRAEAHLSDIFQTKAQVLLEGSVETEAAAAISAPIRRHGEVAGTIRIGPRAEDPRFLSEDMALLSFLADAFSFLLENLSLREKRLKQEKREQELVLNASRSELKALRAQVNPHFLFNALNAIAGLIPQDPDRAEQTIEQLAEVFRYTLRGSEREWVRLEDELEAVRAYLDVEQARFRDGLRVRVECPAEARNVRIPAMIVHTLVENATRHGVGATSAPGIIEVRATVEGETLRVEVRDNGPGFAPAAAHALRSRDGGYGLRNVRERLQTHFGGGAALKIGRDAARGMTVVAVEMPLATLVAQPGKALAS
jgi:two-component sensor histidine kinase